MVVNRQAFNKENMIRCHAYCIMALQSHSSIGVLLISFSFLGILCQRASFLLFAGNYCALFSAEMSFVFIFVFIFIYLFLDFGL